MPYHIGPAFAGLSAFSGAVGVARCAGCGRIDNRNEIRPKLTEAPYKSPYLSETTDGVLLASRAFQKRYAEEGWSGLIFLPVGRGYAELRAERSVRLRVERKYLYDRTGLEPGIHPALPEDRIVVHHTRCCRVCGRYRQELGGGARVIRRGEVPVGDTEFVFGDVALGEDDAQAVDLIAGDALRPAHLRERLRGVSVFSKVTYEGWSQPGAATHRAPGQGGPVIALRDSRT